MTNPLRSLLTLATFGAVTLALAPAASAQYRDRDEPYRPDQQYRGDDRQDGEQVSIATFHDALDPHGRWFEHSQYGYVWSPDVDRNWRPYTRGEWKFTEEHGWYWQAEEPWGWAVFHYGRWFLDDDAGWVWVPGTEWAPAWVAWRDGDEAVGWAPLPPEAEWRYGGLHFSDSYYNSPRFTSAWIFAPIAVLGGYAAYRYIFPASRNYALVNQTRSLPSNRTVNNRIVNQGIAHNRAQQLTGRPITPLRIVSAAAPPARGAFGGGPPRGTLQVYRPNVSRAAVTTAPPKLATPPQRDWQHGRPGLQAPPFQRPGGWTQPAPQAQPRPAPQPGFAQPGQRPPISPPAQVQQPAPQAQPAAPPRGQNPLIRPTPQYTNPAASAPPPAPPRAAPTPPPAAPARAAPPPQPAPQQPRAAAPAGAPPQGKGPPAGQGTPPQKKRVPPDPNAPPPKQ